MICESPRDLPSVGKLLEEESYQTLISEHGDHLVKCAIREVLTESRQLVLEGKKVNLDGLYADVVKLLEPSQKRVLNLTGTILHTNLGRAPLGDRLPRKQQDR